VQVGCVLGEAHGREDHRAQCKDETHSMHALLLAWISTARN
jgi:hypothetical protein